MKTALRISILLNLVLVAAMSYEILSRNPPSPGTQPAFEHLQAPVSAQSPQSNNPSVAQPVLNNRFDWSQVEAADYPTYVANLRAIRCPEQTVREIIRADVASLFDMKRRELAGSLAVVSQWSPTEEARLVATLFGDSASSCSVSPDRPSETQTQPVRLPLVLQTQALATLKLNDEQRDELGDLVQQFIQEVGGANQNADDPEYLARWQKAQPRFDEMIVRTIGRRAMVDLDEAVFATSAGTR